MAIGKVGANGTLNENGAFYSVQDVNALLEGIVRLPEATEEDAGKAVVVEDDGSYGLDSVSGGGGSLILTMTLDAQEEYGTLNKTYNEIKTAIEAGIIPYLIRSVASAEFVLDFVTYYGYNLADCGGYYVVLGDTIFASETTDGTLVGELNPK